MDFVCPRPLFLVWKDDLSLLDILKGEGEKKKWSLVGFPWPCCAGGLWKVNQRLALSSLDVLGGSGGKNAALHGNASPQNHPSAMVLTAFVHDGVGSFVDSVLKGKVILHKPWRFGQFETCPFPIIG